jgi:2-dehydro-3-deoxygluconokinase
MQALTGTNIIDDRGKIQVLAIGETMMAFEALEPWPLRETRHFKKWIGGAENNFVIGLARLGLKAGWFSRLGQDEFGAEILRSLRGEGVDVSRVIQDPDTQTGVFFVEPRTGGDPRCYYYRSASAATHLTPKDLDRDYINSCQMLYLTGITPAISASAHETAKNYFRMGKEAGSTLIFDPNLRLKIWSIEQAREALIPLMLMSDYVLPGSEELKLLMDRDKLDDAIARALDLGMSNLVIKAGSDGALLATSQGERHKVPPFEVPGAVSAMGAGDCFAAGFTAGLLNKRTLKECLRWGNALGAFCLKGSGPYQTLPELPEFMDFLQGEESVTR